MWEEGVDLHDAWYYLASEEKKNMIRNAETEAKVRILERRLQMELEMDLSTDSYCVIGCLRKPRIRNEPEILSSVFLYSRPEVSWDDDTMSGRGQTYDMVRVYVRKDAERYFAPEPPDTTTVKQSQSDSAQKPLSGYLGNDSHPTQRKKKGYSELALTVIESLACNTNWLSISSEKKIDEFNAKFFEMHPVLRGQIRPFTSRSLRNYQSEYLARRRKDQERSGK